MIDQDALITKLAAANPVPDPMPHGPDERAEADRVLRHVLSYSHPPWRLDRAGSTWLGKAFVTRGLGRLGEAIALAVAIGAVIAVVLVTAWTGGHTHPTALPPASSAAAALDRAAHAAATGTLAPKLRIGQAWYTEEASRYVSPALGNRPVGRRSTGNVWTWRTWNGATGDVAGGEIRVGGLATGPPGFGDWSGMWLLHSDLRTPRSVLRALGTGGSYWGYTNAPGASPVSDTDTTPFTKLAKAAALLGDAPLRPRQRATVFRAIANLPGLTYLGATRDPLGRPGVAVAAEGSPRALNVNAPQRYRFELIFNPSTGKVLGFRTVALKGVQVPANHPEGVPRAANVRAGQLMFAWAYVRTGVVQATRLPSLVCSHELRSSRCGAIVSNAAQ